MHRGTALLTAFRKDYQLRDFAQVLIQREWSLFASAGTKKFLDTAGIPSTDIGDLVGPPILGHRVVTLDRKIYAAILARRDNADDIRELKRIGVDPIDLVYVDLYPLAEELKNPNRTVESVIEKTDIGGPTLLRAAAKGGRYVLSHSNQFQQVLHFFDHRHESPKHFLAGLAAHAEEVVSEYATLSARFHQSVALGTF